VVALDYEAYEPAAEKQLGVIGVEVVERWPGMRIAIHHRHGYLEPGIASVVIACASSHRAEAFEAAAYAIDRIKQIVPIWKRNTTPMDRYGLSEAEVPGQTGTLSPLRLEPVTH
jgi:molybdopterin synthase catalytic subunit